MKRIALTASLFLTVFLFTGAFSPIQWFRAVPAVSGWTKVNIGGGGSSFEIQIANNGTKIMRNDTGGVYTNTGSGWVFALTTTSMPAADVCYNCLQNDAAGIGLGAGAIGIAPSDSTHMYAFTRAYLYYSTDTGAHWTRSTRAQENTLDSNASPSKVYHAHIAVDPQNPSFVWLGSGGVGVSSSTDGGATFTNVSTGTIPLPSPANSGQLICFDPSGGTSGGKTLNIFVHSFSNGTYFSHDSGSTWTNVTGSGPSSLIAMVCDSTGRLFAVDNTSSSYGSLWRYSGGAAGTWTKLLSTAVNGTCITDVAVNPNDTTKIYAGELCGNGGNGGTLDFSLSNGDVGTWTIQVASSCAASDVPWLAGLGTAACGGGQHITFDPSQTNLMWQVSGSGIWTTTPPTTNVAFTWTSHTAAMENLSARWITVPNGSPGYPLMIAEDESTWTITDIDSGNNYKSKFGPSFSASLAEGWSGDYPGDNPSTVVSLTMNNGCFHGATPGPLSGYSNDGGVTWTVFSDHSYCTTNNTSGGCIMAVHGHTDHFAILPDDGGGTNTPWYTSNSGTTWTAATVTGVSTSNPTGWGPVSNLFTNGQQCASDKVTTDKVYLYNKGFGISGGKPGIFSSTDAGHTYAQVDSGNFYTACYGSGSLADSNQLNIQLKSVFGQSGELWWTHGDTGTRPDTQSFLCHSTDGGATWTKIPNIETAICMGFGKAAAGHTYPAVWFIGWYNVSGTYTYGLWRSIDWDGAQTFQCQGVCSNDNTSNGFVGGKDDIVVTCEADPNKYGRLYAATGGSGFYYWTSSN